MQELKFRRQHPVGPYILDFYCPAARLAIEVDGQQHYEDAQAAADARRTEWLGLQGIDVIRFPALSIRDALPDVLETILREITGR